MVRKRGRRMKEYEHLKKLYESLRHSRLDFEPDKYKFEIGRHIFDKLVTIPELEIMFHNPFVKNTIFGIEIELKYHNPDWIKLYEDITNDLIIAKTVEQK